MKAMNTVVYYNPVSFQFSKRKERDPRINEKSKDHGNWGWKSRRWEMAFVRSRVGVRKILRGEAWMQHVTSGQV